MGPPVTSSATSASQNSGLPFSTDEQVVQMYPCSTGNSPSSSYWPTPRSALDVVDPDGAHATTPLVISSAIRSDGTPAAPSSSSVSDRDGSPATTGSPAPAMPASTGPT